MSKKLTLDEILKALNSLSTSEVLYLLNEYAKTTHKDVSREKRSIIINDLQDNLILNKVNKSCPHCNSTIIVKNGRKNGVMMFKCKSCGKNFTLFTNTILEKTRYSWDVWIDMVWYTLNGTSIKKIRQYLIAHHNIEGIDYKTVFMWRHKIIHALASIPMPKLSGVIQIDETYFRETQKGSRHLVSFLKDYKRYPRRKRNHSIYGVMGNEYANVVTAIDTNGYVVAKVVGLGKLSVSKFVDLFDDYLVNPSYLCTDKNNIYPKYADLKGVPLYIKLSTYESSLKKMGYKDLDKVKSWEIINQAKLNNKLISRLYKKQELDYIYQEPSMPYDKFKELKEKHGLNLGKVNGFHSVLKDNILKDMSNVSTKYLPDYIGFETFKHNWRVTNNKKDDAFSRKEAKTILIEILKQRVNYTKKDLDNTTVNFPRATGKYMSLLKRKQAAVRMATKNKYFKFGPEDNVVSFNKLTFLEELPAYHRENLRKKYKISAKWGKSAVCKALSQMPGIEDDIWWIINLKRGKYLSDANRKILKKLWGIN